MKRNRTVLIYSIASLMLAIFVAAIQLTRNSAVAVAASDEATVSHGPVVSPAMNLGVDAANLRTHQARMDALAYEPAVPQVVEAPFLPTMDPADYQAAKAAASSAVRSAKPVVAASGPLAPPTLKFFNFDGITSGNCGGCRPPDTEGATGPTQFFETTNEHVDIFSKTNGANVESETLATFFGYATEPLFDPRVLYDSVWNRWIVTADSFAESSSVQRFFFAISTTSDATGSYLIYNVNLNNTGVPAGGAAWDYPMVGMDQDTVFFTGNVFNSTPTYQYSEVFAVSKAVLYNGYGFSVPAYVETEGTLAPPVVIDNVKWDYFIVANEGTGNVDAFTLNAGGRWPQTFTGPVTVCASCVSIPPNAAQPGTGVTLDTLDGRFQNVSTQKGQNVWNVNTISLGGTYPAPHWYRFNLLSNTTVDGGTFFESGSSYDWNPSITVDTHYNIMVTWNATDPANSQYPSVLFSGKLITDASIPNGGTVLYSASTYYAPTGSSPERWGDYSAITPDPSVGLRAWLVNEYNQSTSVWGTRIGRIGWQ
jgi:hypothetical protein